MMGPPLGATPRPGGGCHFEVWAPFAKTVDVEIVAPRKETIRLKRRDDGYHGAEAPNVEPGTQYYVRLDGGPRRADPASRSQPAGLHGPSEYVDLQTHSWKTKRWRGHRRSALVIYELHVGTYSAAGTFDALIPHLGSIRDLGVNAIEIMPVAQFSGERNWGYDGVFLFAPQHSYGGPAGFQRLVDAAHAAGLSVLLDVVYNHLGPEGNHLAEFGPYYNPKRPTPWGDGINVDGKHSDAVRHFLISNVLQWLEDYRLDGLRLDAVHIIDDHSAKTFLEEMAETAHDAAKKRGAPFHLIAESSANDTVFVRPVSRHGYGLDAVWNDDFARSLYTFTSLDRNAYVGDYPHVSHLAKAFTDGFVLDGQWSNYRKRRHGRSSRDVPGDRFVVFADNHDQAGNRANGERLTTIVPWEALKVSAAAVLLAPNIPMLFMGEEWGEPAPFPFFTDHSDAKLRAAVTEGRKKEFLDFGWTVEPMDHAAKETFQRAKLQHRLKEDPKHAALWSYYQRLLRTRREDPALRRLDKKNLEAAFVEDAHLLLVTRRHRRRRVLLVLHGARKPVTLTLAVPKGRWKKVLDSNDETWGGPGAKNPGVISSKNGTARLTISPMTALLYETGGTAR